MGAASALAGADMPAILIAAAARRLMAPPGRESRRIGAEVTTVGVEDVTSIERIVIGAAPPAGADINKRACAGAANRHSASSLSIR
jgi:hypothetical protein